MFGLTSLAGGLLGGGGGGGMTGSGGRASAEGSQDGNTITSRNDGSFSVGGGVPSWAIVAVVAVIGIVAGIVAWKKL